MAPTALKHFVLIFVQNSAVKKVSILPERRVKCWPGCWHGCRSDQREENTTASSRGRRWMCKSGKYCLLMRRGNKWTQSSFIIMQVQGMHNFWVSLSISPLSANFAQDFFHIFFFTSELASREFYSDLPLYRKGNMQRSGRRLPPGVERVLQPRCEIVTVIAVAMTRDR